MDAVILRASPNSLSAARSLGRAGLEVVIAATGADRAIRLSRYVSRFERLEDINDRTIYSRLMELPTEGEKPFLLPTGDQDALVVARHQRRLREKYCFVTPSYEALEAIVDKSKLYATASQLGIARPRFQVVSQENDIEAAIAHVGTPCYVKPALSHEWRRFRRGKLEYARTPDELRRILLDFVELGLVAIPMEIVPGSDSEVYSFCTYIDRNGNFAGWRTKRKLRQFPLSAGNGCCQEVCNLPEVAELGHRLLSSTGHRGPATVEFRRDANDGRLVLMEINARTILGQEMITGSGLDVPLIAYHDAKGLPLPPPRDSTPSRWVFFGEDFRAFRQLRKRKVITTSDWIRSLFGCRRFAYFAADDPMPFLARFVMWVGRQLRRRTRRVSDPDL